MADLSPGLISLFEKAIAADPLKFVIFFLFAFCAFLTVIFLRFFSKMSAAFSKFMTEQMQSWSKDFKDQFDKTQLGMNSLLDRLMAFESKLNNTFNDFHKTLNSDLTSSRRDLLETKHQILVEIEKMRVNIADLNSKLNSGDKTVGDAVGRHEVQLKVLDKNFNTMIEALRNRKNGL